MNRLVFIIICCLACVGISNANPLSLPFNHSILVQPSDNKTEDKTDKSDKKTDEVKEGETQSNPDTVIAKPAENQTDTSEEIILDMVDYPAN